MDANQRSEANNQTNNGGNEKGTPGAQGKTRGESPLDHTYPKGGAQQGITDSHQQAMEQRSAAYGKLEQPVGDRPSDQGVSLQRDQQSDSVRGDRGNQQSSTQGGGQRGPHSALPRNEGGSMGQQSAKNQGTQGGGQAGPQSDAGSVQRSGSMQQQSDGTRPDQRSDSGKGHDSTDRIGSQTGNYQREMGVHQSNDLQGGLPRSPGNAGPYPEARSSHQTGPDNHADLLRNDRGVHESNNSSGGLPRSPGGANKLSADEKMDDDTGFSNPRRR